MTRWIPTGPNEERPLLDALGISSTEELFTDVPRSVRMGRLGVGAGLDEREVVAAVSKIAARNRPYTRFASFLGGRIPIRYIPAAVDAILSRSEFYTSYTPYQPEASQGMLQALFEFQSLWTELTGLEVANASLYDGATAAGEALRLSLRLNEGHRYLVPASLPWEEKSVLASYATASGARLEEVPFEPGTGRIDLGALRESVGRGDVGGMLADLPNGFGVVDEGLRELKGILGSVPLTISADPLALVVVEPPGSWGADLVVGEGQGFCSAPSFGGPSLGLFAARREHTRQIPGRIVGATLDREGRRAFTLTLQTREQHIRRSRATSNICTNQSLLALAFVVYASTVGPRGLESLAGRLAEKARTLATAIGAVPGIRSPQFDAPYLWEFTAGLERTQVKPFLDRLRKGRVLGGIPLADPRPGAAGPGGEWFRVAVHEAIEERQIARFARLARTAAQGIAT